MSTEKQYGSWKGRKVLFIGDSLTARRIYPEIIGEILGIEPYYHCKPGADIKGMIDGDYGLSGCYTAETDAAGYIRPLCPADVAEMDLVVLYGGYNNRFNDIGVVGDLYRTDGSGQNTVAGLMQYAIDRIYETLLAADNMTCRLLVVTVDCAGKYCWVDASGYEESTPGTGRTLEAMANVQKAVAAYNGIPCCDLFHNSGINSHTWAAFGASPMVDDEHYSPYRLDENGKPVSTERIRYQHGESYYQIRDSKGVLEKYEGMAAFPYIADQLHKSPAGYRRIAEVIAGAIVSSYGI